MRQSESQPSSDNPDEVFDLVDLQDQVIGHVRRGQAHRDPRLVHRSVQILVFGSDDRLLLQRRSLSKDLFPGYYCASASGHVASGETYAITAEREVEEELGVRPRLRYLGKTLVRSDVETEMTALFVARSDGPFHFHPTETQGGRFVALAELGRARTMLPMTPALLAALDAVDAMQRTHELATLLAQL
jgi:isopentenyldiphosphate isomerase